MDKKNILLYDNGQPFDINTPYYEPLGGSETSIILLGKGLSELGHNVVLLTSKKINRQNKQTLIIDNSINFSGYAENSDIIIINRNIPQNIDQFRHKNVYYYAHDAYDQLLIQWMGINNNLHFFKKIFCVSEWQKDTFIKYFNIQSDQLSKFKVVGNCIDYSLSYGHAKKEYNKLIFAGIPYKGIPILGDIFNDVCILSKRDDLELHLYSHMNLYGQNNDTTFDNDFVNLSKIKNVFLHKLVSMKELNNIFKLCSIYLSPNLYHETFGINLVMAQANGCLPISTNLGAVNETIYYINNIIDEPNIQLNSTYNKYINKICEVLEYNNSYKHKLGLLSSNFTKKWDYLNISSLISEELLCR